MKALSELLLSTNGLTKQYGHHKAVDKVNLHIKKGAIYGFQTGISTAIPRFSYADVPDGVDPST